MNSLGQMYRYTGHDTNPWIGIPGKAEDIGVAADGTVWHVNSAGGIYRYTGDQPS
ncbi:tectonin domain-containing protein [Streptomyces lydicamycinicus]|uniref:tectonin domain-containing protein n=1 Tax=Streptomyces lydicamycinicus TaxID=1546107 RepID=UPI00351E0C0A